MSQSTETAPAPTTGRPGPTPLRAVKIADDTWTPAMARAHREGEEGGLSGVIRRFLEEYADGA